MLGVFSFGYEKQERGPSLELIFRIWIQMIFHWDIPRAFLKVYKTFLNIIFSWLPLSLAYWNFSYHYPLMLFSFFNCLFLRWKVMYSDLPEFCVNLAFPLDFPGIVRPTSREVFKDDIPDEIPFYISLIVLSLSCPRNWFPCVKA